MAKQQTGETPEVIIEPKFTKAQLINGKRYSNNKDMLTALLKEGESYSHSEVSKLTSDFMKGAIK